MFYLIYKITNRINGKIYIGAHQTNDIEDSYMGSGKILRLAQAKYGIDNFSKDILFKFDSASEMYAKEKELVSEEFVNDPLTYNLKVGGDGGWDHINNNRTFEERSINGRKGAQATNGWHKITLNMTAEERATRAAKSGKTRKERYPNGVVRGEKNGMFGQTHTESARSRISTGVSGSKNGSHGSKWMHSISEMQTKRIVAADIDNYLAAGWEFGRKQFNK